MKRMNAKIKSIAIPQYLRLLTMASVNMGTIVHQQWPGVVTTNVEHFQSPQSLKEIQQYSSPQRKKKEDRTKSDRWKVHILKISEINLGSSNHSEQENLSTVNKVITVFRTSAVSGI